MSKVVVSVVQIKMFLFVFPVKFYLLKCSYD